jgi:heme oxygenase
MTLEVWRDRSAELRELAASTTDVHRKRRYLELVERWEEFAHELEHTRDDERARIGA